MIGKPVLKETFRTLLHEEEEKTKIIGDINKELKALKPGECLVYEARVGMESVLSLSLSFSVKNLKLVTRPGKVYAYKER